MLLIVINVDSGDQASYKHLTTSPSSSGPNKADSSQETAMHMAFSVGPFYGKEHFYTSIFLIFFLWLEMISFSCFVLS